MNALHATTKLRLLGAFATASLVTSTLLAAACGSDDTNPQPVTPVFTIDASGTQTPDATVTTGGDSGSTPDSGVIADTGPLPDVDAAACTEDSGCWSCTPENTAQFLNQCTGSSCTPFDNTRVPNYDGGTLTWSM